MSDQKPYWHIDAKWIFGLGFSFFLGISSILLVMAKLTSPEVAIPTATYFVATQFSREGLDNADGLEEIRQQFLDSGQQAFYPFGDDQPVILTRQEVQIFSPKELRLRVFRQVIEPIYYGEISDEALSQYGILAVLNQQTHQTLSHYARLSWLPTVLLLIGFSYFSWGYGKLTNPAITFLAHGLPLALFFYLVKHTTPLPGDEGPLSFFPQEILPEITTVAQIFNMYTLIGTGLLSAALVLKIFNRLRKK